MEARREHRQSVKSLAGQSMAAAILGLAAFACSLLPSALAADLSLWRAGIILPKSDAGFIMMPQEARFAAKEGLRIEPSPVQSDAIGMKSLLAGEVDSYEGSPGDALIAGSRGADVKVLGCAWPQLVHGIFVRSDITDLKQLKGKTFAISAPAAMPDLLARAALRDAGINPSDVTFASLGGDTDRFKALSAGVADGAVVSTEYLPIASKDVKLLVAGRDIMPNFMRVCVIVTGATLKSRHDDAVHFMAAEIAGLRFAAAHRDETIALTQKITHAKADDPRPAFLFDEVLKYHDMDPEMPLPLPKLAWMQDLLVKAGNIQHPADLAKSSDPSIREAALKLVGPPVASN